MASPIFVIGKNRSGTKWISNILSNHQDIATVSREGAGGIIENNLINRYPVIFPDLEIDEHYYALASCLHNDNILRCSPAPNNLLFLKKFNSYKDIIRSIMETAAANESARYWLQKADPLSLHALIEQFPDAKFVLIERNPVANIQSTIALKHKRISKINTIFTECAHYQLCSNTMNRFKKDDRFIYIQYEEMTQNKERTAKRLCDFLGIAYNEGIHAQNVAPNTSFDDAEQNRLLLTETQKGYIRKTLMVLNFIPNFFLLSAYRRYTSRNPTSLIRKTFTEKIKCFNNDSYS